jgi:hypothetical protein
VLDKSQNPSPDEPDLFSDALTKQEWSELQSRARRYYGLRILVFSAMAAAFFLGLFANLSGASFLPKAFIMLASLLLALKGSKAVIAVTSLQLGGLSPQIIQAMAIPGAIAFAAEAHGLMSQSVGETAYAILCGGFFGYLAAGALVGLKSGALGPMVLHHLDKKRGRNP